MATFFSIFHSTVTAHWMDSVSGFRLRLHCHSLLKSMYSIFFWIECDLHVPMVCCFAATLHWQTGNGFNFLQCISPLPSSFCHLTPNFVNTAELWNVSIFCLQIHSRAICEQSIDYRHWVKPISCKHNITRNMVIKELRNVWCWMITLQQLLGLIPDSEMGLECIVCLAGSCCYFSVLLIICIGSHLIIYTIFSHFSFEINKKANSPIQMR